MQRWQVRWMSRLVLAAGCALPLAATHAAQAASPAPVTVAGTQQWDLRASGSQRAYRIFVAVPDKPAPASGYGVLYVLDGNAMFLTAVEAVRAYERRPDVPKDIATIVVGIGYPEGSDIGRERTLDLTPSATEDPRVKAPAGGGDAFLAFIERDLKPKVATLGAIDRQRQAIFGHSFGGLFVLHTLARQPEAFTVRVAASPSIWFSETAIKRELAALPASRKADAAPLRVLLTAGEYEQTLSPFARIQPNADRIAHGLKSRAQVDNGRAVAALLATVPGVQVRFDEIAGEDHGTVIPAAIGRAVAFMLIPPLPVPAVPTAQEYMALTAEQRYDLRLRVRDLPDAQRIPWLTRLKQTLHDGLTKQQAEALHAERNRMDSQHGTQPHAVNAP